MAVDLQTLATKLAAARTRLILDKPSTMIIRAGAVTAAYGRMA